MTEATCDSYISKLAEIQNICCNETTTKSILENKINDLAAIDEIIESEIGVIGIPVTMTHFDKFILIRITRVRDTDLQNYVQCLIEKRHAHTNVLMNEQGYEATIPYCEETNLIKNYEVAMVENSSGMRTRRNLIKKISRK